MRRTLPVLLAGSLLAIGCQAWAQISVIPSAPRPHDTVRVVVPNGVLQISQAEYNYDPRQTRVSMAGNKITVALRFEVNLVDLLPGQSTAGMDLPLGQFPEGSYEVEIVRRSASGAEAPALGTVRFTVAPRTSAEPVSNYTDLWWDPQESGWGLGIVHHGSGKIFATWFAYGPDRSPIWYVISDGTWITPTRYQGAIYRTAGPYFGECDFRPNCARPFDPSLVARVQVGTGELSFLGTTASAGAASFTIDGRTSTKLLERQPF